MLKLLHFCMSVCIVWKQRALLFSMKLSNANPVSTWMGDSLTQQCSVECSCIFYLFIYFIVIIIIIILCLFFSSSLCHSYQWLCVPRNLVFSMKLSNANPVSAWMCERLTLTGAVDFSCIFFFFFFFCACSFFHYFVIHSSNSVCICSADALSYDMTRICLSSIWEDNIKLWKENSSQSADMYNQGRIRRGFGGFNRAPPTSTFESKVHFHWKLWINLGFRIYPKYPHPLFLTYTYLQVLLTTCE